LLDYKYATIKIAWRRYIIVETQLDTGLYGTVGVGEDVAHESGILGPAVFNALGIWIDDFPVTPSKVLKALGRHRR